MMVMVVVVLFLWMMVLFVVRVRRRASRGSSDAQGEATTEVLGEEVAVGEVTGGDDVEVEIAV